MLRQIAILVVTPAPASHAPWLDQIFDQERRVLTQTGLLTIAMDMPCRRRGPTLQRVWAETLDDVREADLVDNTIARLDALSRVGPLTIVTSWRDWPALKLGALRCGSDLGVLAALQAHPGNMAGEHKVELLDLALWLGHPAKPTMQSASPVSASLMDREDSIVAETVQLYRVFLRFLAVTGRMSSSIYRSADDAIGLEVRRLRSREKTRRLQSRGR
jgi:hypothetical protein